MDKQRQDRLIASISQTLTTAVNTKLDKVVKSEMKNNVLPCEGGRAGMSMLLCEGWKGRDEHPAMLGFGGEGLGAGGYCDL